MPQCAKTHLQQYLVFQNFPGRTPGPPCSRGGKGKGRKDREGKGREGGRGRIGRDGKGQGREGGREGRIGGGGVGEGTDVPHGLRPLETSSGSAPATSSPGCWLTYERTRREAVVKVVM